MTVNGGLTVSLVAVAPGLVYKVHVISNLSRHVMDYHLELGQLWWCPVEWYSVWKGTAQDCMDHLHVWHHADSSVGIKTLGSTSLRGR